MYHQFGVYIRALQPAEAQEESLMDLTSVMVGQDGHSSLVLPSEHGFALRGKPMQLCLWEDRLEYGSGVNGGRSPTCVLRTDNMIGSAVHVRQIRNRPPIYSLEIFNYVPDRRGCCGAQRAADAPIKRRARHVQFQVESEVLAHKWDRAIKHLLSPFRAAQRHDEESGGGEAVGLGGGDMRRRRLLVIVNPVSGVKRAKQTYDSTVQPMLGQAHIYHELLVTNRRFHAKDYVRDTSDLSQFDGIIIVGGDGLLYEVINGLWERDPEGLTALKSMPLGIIRGGTGNGLFATILHHNNHSFDELSATFIAIKGRPMPADLSFVQVASGARHLSFLSLTWGMIADVDLESEGLRCLGSARTTIYALICIARLRGYRGRLSYLPAEEGPSSSPPSSGGQSTTGLLPTASHTNTGTRVVRNEATVQLPPLNEPLPEGQGWVTIEADFLVVLVSHVSHIAEDVHNSPGKSMGDGVFHILVVRKPVSRARLLDLFLQIEGGKHVHCDAVEVFWAKAYRLEPLTTQGIYSLDGEPVDYGPIQAAVSPHAIQLISDASHLLP